MLNPKKLELFQKQMAENIRTLLRSHETTSEFLKNPEEVLKQHGFTIDAAGIQEIKKLQELSEMGKMEVKLADIQRVGSAIHPLAAGETSSMTSSSTSSMTSSGI